MSANGSVTGWIEAVKQGDDSAAAHIWNRYADRLLTLAQKKLDARTRRVADEEDVVASAMESCLRRARDGKHEKLDDREDLWKLLATITINKASKQGTHFTRLKRGGGNVRGDSAFEESGSGIGAKGFDQIVDHEPTPEEAAMLTELCDRLLNSLDDSLRQVAVWKLEGLTHKEIAERLDCVPRTVVRKMEIIRRVLSEEIAGEE